MDQNTYFPERVTFFRLPEFVANLYQAPVDNSAPNLLGFAADGSPVAVEVSSLGGGLSSPVITGVSSNPATTLTSAAGNIAWTGAESNLYKITLTENSTLEDPSTPVVDATYQFIVTQDATGSRTLAFGPLFKQPDTNVLDLSSAPANSKVVLTAVYDGTDMLITSVGTF